MSESKQKTYLVVGTIGDGQVPEHVWESFGINEREEMVATIRAILSTVAVLKLEVFVNPYAEALETVRAVVRDRTAGAHVHTS